MRTLYYQLKARKSSGEKLSFEALTDAQLYQLYIRENTIAPMIADLFDVSMPQFAERRRRCIGSTLRDLSRRRAALAGMTADASDGLLCN